MKEPTIESTTVVSGSEPDVLATQVGSPAGKRLARKRKQSRKIRPRPELVCCQLFAKDFMPLVTVSVICLFICLSTIVYWSMAGWFMLVVYLISVIIILKAQPRMMKVRFSERGFEIASLNYAGMMGVYRNAVWSDLHSVRLAYELPEARSYDPFDASWARSGFLVFDLTSGGYLMFPLMGLDPLNAEKLFTSLAKWASPLVQNPDVLSLQRNVLTQGALSTDLTFTRLWEESLRSRFETTNFVPLTGGHTLLNEKYRVILLLVCGGLSAVYLAEKSDGRKVILKEMHLPTGMAEASRQKALELFEREARILATLHHEQIAKVLDFFTEAGRTYLVIEHIAGLTLRQLVQLKGALEEKKVLELAKQAANILYYMHNCQPPIIHRDLTPDNLIVKEDNTLVLIDFGAATELIENATGTLIGKQSYIPSEQFRGKACAQSDIYALGGTMNYLLTGADPEPLSQSHPRKMQAKLSVSVDELVAACTEFEPESRVHTAEQLVERIDILLKSLVVPGSGASNE